jgi:hypothetical protein
MKTLYFICINVYTFIVNEYIYINEYAHKLSMHYAHNLLVIDFYQL